MSDPRVEAAVKALPKMRRVTKAEMAAALAAADAVGDRSDRALLEELDTLAGTDLGGSEVWQDRMYELVKRFGSDAVQSPGQGKGDDDRG